MKVPSKGSINFVRGRVEVIPSRLQLNFICFSADTDPVCACHRNFFSRTLNRSTKVAHDFIQDFNSELGRVYVGFLFCVAIVADIYNVEKIDPE